MLLQSHIQNILDCSLSAWQTWAYISWIQSVNQWNDVIICLVAWHFQVIQSQAAVSPMIILSDCILNVANNVAVTCYGGKRCSNQNQINFIHRALFIHACAAQSALHKKDRTIIKRKESSSLPPSILHTRTYPHTHTHTHTHRHTLTTGNQETWQGTENWGSATFGAIHTGRSHRLCHGGQGYPGPQTLTDNSWPGQRDPRTAPPAAAAAQTQLPV